VEEVTIGEAAISSGGYSRILKNSLPEKSGYNKVAYIPYAQDTTKTYGVIAYQTNTRLVFYNSTNEEVTAIEKALVFYLRVR